ncbi:hypothetical protein KA977_07345 [Candidatus Dependentiae bacterium]|nr:hypothetical protein [Candidatus Dependentiae bacterium]
MFSLICCRTGKKYAAIKTYNYSALKMTAKKTYKAKTESFPENLNNSGNKPFFAEISGAVSGGEYIYLVNDKPIQDKSPIFKIHFDKQNSKFHQDITYLTSPIISSSEKFEDITITPDGKYIIASTAFDRVMPGTNKLDNYNKLITWSTDNEDSVTVINHTYNDGIISSVSLRENIKKCLADTDFPEGPEYFKIEGLTALPNNKILLGIREYGKKHDDFNYTIKIICSEYFIEKNKLNIKNDWKLIYNFDTAKMKELNYKQLGLSGLTFDPVNNILYILTSYEDSISGFDGYLWYITLEDFFNSKQLSAVYDETGNEFLSFNPHKPEGAALIDAETLLIVYDDDRMLTMTSKKDNSIEYKRKPNEFWYEIIKIKRK